MTEKKKQFTKLKKSIGHVAPEELGKMCREYFKTKTAPYAEAVKVFDGNLFTS